MSLKKQFIILFGIQFILISGLGIMTLRLFRNQEELSKSRDIRFRLWLLADELRQSSDDLTRMARTYVATGNPEYERQYWTVLDIRNGKIPRPLNYNQICWDLVTAPGQKPSEDGETISLHNLMIREGFTVAEFDKLAEAQKNSDELVNVERIAMNAVKGLFADRDGSFTVKRKPDREFAIRLMNDEAYHMTKARIMKPINEFYVMFIKRTTNDVVNNEQHSKNLLRGIVTLILIVLGIFAFSYVMILRQIGKREKAEDTLRESEARFRDIIVSSSDWIWEIDQQWKYCYSSENIEKILGYTPDEIIGKSPFDFMTQEEKDHSGPYFENILKTKGVIKDLENWNLHKDGHKVCLLTNGFPVLDKTGKLTGYRGVDKDITERKRAEEEIQQKNKELRILNAEKDKFFSLIAHDLRSPFNSLLGFTQMIIEELPALKPEEIKKIALSMRKTTANLYSLLENLLEWSRLQRDLISFNPEAFPLRHRIAETMELLMESANKKKIAIRYDIPAEMEVYTDKIIFEAIIRNLASNAIKFTHEKGEVTISAKVMPDNSVQISISDTGIGMNQTMVTNLFRLDENTNRKGTQGEPSTGLGLIICKEFIEKHGGELWVESEEGKGSTFRFTLPSHNH